MRRKLTGGLLVALGAVAYWILLGAIENSAAFYQEFAKNADERFKAAAMADGNIPVAATPDPLQLKILLSFSTFPFVLFSIACVAAVIFGFYLLLSSSAQSNKTARVEFRSRKK
ncbi:hypothetical protein [Sphingomonas sp.]|uniref:hypothetical protein n=1 Tax=Sphingomonas sp. TaxID=28214 RepID=UPI001B1DB0E7|nr:hypothetical protein [Sphingomonas sp.]MBO9712685.1 hypothetical protein [Sphingomonas sp.]